MLLAPKDVLKRLGRGVLRRLNETADTHEIPEEFLELFVRDLTAELALEAGRLEAAVPRRRRKKDPRPAIETGFIRVEAL